MSTCAEKLNDAIESGAQMIAITSPFGSGKTSIVDLLQEKRTANKNEYILKIPMWSQLNQLRDKTNELHRNFLYQISSLISHKRGTYISRRLSNNYGLLTLHASNNRTWVFFSFALLFGGLAWLVNEFSEVIESYLPILKDKTDILSVIFIVVAVYIAIIVLTRAEIIFSSQKSENERTIDEDEIVDLYRNEILKYGTRFGNFIRLKTENCRIKPFSGKTYIIVVEDLDRTDDGNAVIDFLTELRKYYLPINQSPKDTSVFKNKVVFIVNIKSESVLLAETEEKESVLIATNDGDNLNSDNSTTGNDSSTILTKHLFAKIFDYVLDLQTINIIDYKIVLEGLLKSKIELLKKYGFNTNDTLIDIPGMLWIIHGQTLDIREIKNRLNKTFLIYDTLLSRFPENKELISIEKCAVVAYITTAFELDFHQTKDSAFQQIIELKIKNELTFKTCKEILSNQSDEYINNICDLVNAKLIDESYRMYCYNYPKNSRIYSYSETVVQKAILYGEESDELDSSIDTVFKEKSTIIVDSFNQMEQLKLRLPHTVFHNEKLYVQALKHVPNEIILWFEKFDRSSSAIDKNISEILQILNYDKNRSVFNADFAEMFCSEWENIFTEDALLKLRELICENFASEIIWYKKLFFGVHNIISESEMKLLELTDAISLTNSKNDSFGLTEIANLVNKFISYDTYTKDDANKLYAFLWKNKSNLDKKEVALLFISFMNKTNGIIPEFEKFIVDLLLLDAENDEEGAYFISNEDQKSIFLSYQDLINQVNSNDLSETTLNNISIIDKFGMYQRYSSDVAKVLYSNSFFMDYIIIQSHKNELFDFDDKNLMSAIEENLNWLISQSSLFASLRLSIIKTAKQLLPNFEFLFSDVCPIISSTEFRLIMNRKDINNENILRTIPAQIVTDDEIAFLSEYFNNKNRTSTIALKYIKYIAKMEPNVAKKCFYSLNFSYAIQYYRFAKQKKLEVKNLFCDILSLDSCEGKLDFMKNTKSLDEDFEKLIEEDLIDDDELQQTYINIVNQALNEANQTTLTNIYSFNKYYGLKDNINEKFFKEKKYVYYVVTKVLYHQKFIIDSQDRIDILWPVYIDILVNNKYPKTSSIMVKNIDFLRLIMEKRAYVGFEENLRMLLTKIPQDADSIYDAVSYGTKFAVEYFSQIKGFMDYDAAHAFIKVIEKDNQIMASYEVYENAYDKLVNGALKARYTNIRKKHGYKR